MAKRVCNGERGGRSGGEDNLLSATFVARRGESRARQGGRGKVAGSLDAATKRREVLQLRRGSCGVRRVGVLLKKTGDETF